MKLIVGLGNPGDKYTKTRHNVGFMALDVLIEKLEPLEKTFWEENKDLKADLKKIKSKFGDVMLAKPTTFMNNSGFAVTKILNFYKIDPVDLVVVHDDLDLPFGKIRVRFGGSGGGHHGVESIINTLNNDKFLRVRLGIGNPRRVEGKEIKSKNYQNVDEYVLGNISSADRGKVKTMIREAIRSIELILEHGIDRYMSNYNK